MVNRQQTKSQYINKPFLADKARDHLAKKGQLNKLLKTYTKDYSKYKNLNTQLFWDKKFKSPEEIIDQDEMTKQKIDFIISQLPKSRSKILDLGIGQGYLEQRLQKLGIQHDLYGIDISKKSIYRARKKFNGIFSTGNILHNQPYNESFFDAIISIEVIEHIPANEILKLYKKIYKILKKNGKFIISTPLNEGLTETSQNPSAHLRQYTIPILKFEFNKSNFKIKKIQTWYAFKNYYRVKTIISNFLFWKWKPNNVVIVVEKK